MTKPITDPDDWFHADDPLPTDTELLVAQIKSAAQARRRAAHKHRPFCTCCACRVRRHNQARLRAAV